MILFCPRRSDGSPDHAPAPKDYLVELALRRGLPYPEAKAQAERTARQQHKAFWSNGRG